MSITSQFSRKPERMLLAEVLHKNVKERSSGKSKLCQMVTWIDRNK